MLLLKILFVQLILMQQNIQVIGNAFKPDQLRLAEQILIENLDNYINTFESQIKSLKNNLHEYQEEHRNAENDIVKYLSNPINAFLLTKRLTSDWKNVQTFMTNDHSSEMVQNITNESNKGHFPTEDDIKKIIVDLLNLQKEYHLTVEEIASGTFEGIKYSEPLTVIDCFKIGMYLVYDLEEELAIPWLEKSLNLLLNETANNSSTHHQFIKKSDIMDFLSWSNYKIGNFEAALKQAKEAIKLDPNLKNVNRNIILIETGLAKKAERHKISPKFQKKIKV